MCVGAAPIHESEEHEDRDSRGESWIAIENPMPVAKKNQRYQRAGCEPQGVLAMAIAILSFVLVATRNSS